MTVEEAIERLVVNPEYDPGTGPQPCVHTFRQTGLFLIGSHWPLADLMAAIERHGVAFSGPAATGVGHGLVVVDEKGPLFIEARGASEGEANERNR